MRTAQLREVHRLSLHCLQRFLVGNPAPLLALLHPSATMIGHKQFLHCHGKSAIARLCDSPSLLFPQTRSCIPPTITYKLLYSDTSSCTSLCSFTTSSFHSHCVTILWKYDGCQLSILHIHVADNETDLPASPFRQNPSTVAFDCTGLSGEHYYLLPQDILYAEARNMHSCLVCRYRQLDIRDTLSTLQQLLPDYFLKVHRSFLVNAYYVNSLRRYALGLYNGTELPVPEKKYRWVKDTLEQMNI